MLRDLRDLALSATFLLYCMPEKGCQKEILGRRIGLSFDQQRSDFYDVDKILAAAASAAAAAAFPPVIPSYNPCNQQHQQIFRVFHF